MKRILFVDDDQRVLDGLRRSLRPRKLGWQCDFVSSASQALARLGEGAYDVVVSDMKMPGMDGAALLAEVRARHPALGRIVLTGQADREAEIRARLHAHTFLYKPCTIEHLEEAVEEVCALQRVSQT